MIKYLVNAHFKLDAETKKKTKKKKDTASRPTGTMLFNFNTAWKKTNCKAVAGGLTQVQIHLNPLQVSSHVCTSISLSSHFLLSVETLPTSIYHR